MTRELPPLEQPWQPLTIAEVEALLAPLRCPWWIGGGHAIEAFLGGPIRPHGDIDVGAFRDDQQRVRRQLAGWDACCGDPPGTLRPRAAGEHLPVGIHDIWLRPAPTAPWCLQLMLDERDGDDWVYRRDRRVRRPVDGITWERDGIRFLAPEIQLLYKAPTGRDKDGADFDAVAPLLTAEARGWLAGALATAHPGHAWLARL